jgi:hypothetical protein
LVCLVDYIGLKNVTTAPESGLFINSLPGMSTELADKIASTEEVDAEGVWNDVQTWAFLRFKNDVVNTIGEEVKLNQIIYQTKRPKVYRNQAEINLGANYRGVVVQVPESKYVAFYLKEVYVFSDAVAQTTIKVFDLNDGVEVHTQDELLSLGLNTIKIDKTFSLTNFGGINLFIAVDGTNFNTISFYPEYFDFYDCHNMCHSGIQNFHGQTYSLIIEPAEIPLSSDMDFDNLTKFSDGRGVAIGAEIQCSVEEFICQNKKSLEQCLLYLLGAEMLLQKLGSFRLNFFASTNLELTNANRVEFEKRYYSNLKRTLSSIPIHGDSLCFECQTAFVSYKYTDV